MNLTDLRNLKKDIDEAIDGTGNAFLNKATLEKMSEVVGDRIRWEESKPDPKPSYSVGGIEIVANEFAGNALWADGKAIQEAAKQIAKEHPVSIEDLRKKWSIHG